MRTDVHTHLVDSVAAADILQMFIHRYAHVLSFLREINLHKKVYQNKIIIVIEIIVRIIIMIVMIIVVEIIIIDNS